MNLGNPNEMTLLELAETVLRVTGSTSEIIFQALPVDDPRVRQPDITRARQVLGWEPDIGLEDGLRRTVESLGAAPKSVGLDRGGLAGNLSDALAHGLDEAAGSREG